MPYLFSPATVPLSVGDLVDKLKNVLWALPGNEWSALNMTHKMLREMELRNISAEEVLRAFIKRAALNAKAAEPESVDLFTSKEARARLALQELGVRSMSELNDFTKEVLRLMQEKSLGAEAPTTTLQKIPLDSTGLSILRRARQTAPSPQATVLLEDRPRRASKSRAFRPSKGGKLPPRERLYYLDD